MTIETWLRWRKMLTRNRPMPGREIARFISGLTWNWARCSSSMIELAIPSITPGPNLSSSS